MAHWTQISKDPNSPEADAYRQAVLSKAWNAPVTDRNDHFVSLARGKNVLDIGIVDHFLREPAPSGYRWLHGEIRAAAADCYGVDILEEGIAPLKAKGLPVECRDVLSNPLDRTFDLITVGEVIEHLESPGALFKAAMKMLVPNGRLCMSTPNPFYLPRVRSFLRGKGSESTDHVTFLFPSGIAEFAERNGMRLDAYRGVRFIKPAATLAGRAVFGAKSILSVAGVRADAYCPTYIYECVKA